MELRSPLSMLGALKPRSGSLLEDTVSPPLYKLISTPPTPSRIAQSCAP